MSIYNNIDPTAIATLGIYTETYTTAIGGEDIASQVESLGLYDIAPLREDIPAREMGGRYKAKTGNLCW